MNHPFKNKKEFEILFKKHYSSLCRIARGYVKNDYLIEEIVCETFVKLWNNDDIQIKSSAEDYLKRSVINNCLDYYRKNKQQREQTIHLDDIVCSTLADLDEDPLDYLLNKEQQQKLMDAIEQLPERYKKTFKLSRLEELSYEEIAQVMGITKNTVKSNLRSAMASLREILKDWSICILLIYKLLDSFFKLNH